MRAVVKDLATCFPTAIISGRARPKVYEFVQLSELYYAGSHGMDIAGPAKSSSGFKVAGSRSQDKKVHLFLTFSKNLFTYKTCPLQKLFVYCTVGIPDAYSFGLV